MAEPDAGPSATALLRLVADADPQALGAWAEANGLPAPICAALRGGPAATWQHAAEYRGAVIYVQAEIVRVALRQLGRAAAEAASGGQRRTDAGPDVTADPPGPAKVLHQDRELDARKIALAVILAGLALLV